MRSENLGWVISFILSGIIVIIIYTGVYFLGSCAEFLFIVLIMISFAVHIKRILW